MNEFKLNKQLSQDCHQLGTLNGCHILLMNNALVPWIIMVPETSAIDFFEIENSQQQIILQNINTLSAVLKKEYQADKINVATIGNIVKQMHIHIVARHENDYCWPGVVWGAEGKKAYTENDVLKLKQLLQSEIEDFKMV